MYNLDQIKLVSEVLKKNKTNYWTGENCKKFEDEFSKYHNIKYSIAVSNGSVALEIALKALNLKKGDNVIVTPRSFVASASCVLNVNLKPIFADVDYNGNLSIDGISKVYNKNVKAIILVHLNGLSCELDPIIKFVKKKKIFLIEDCSQAHGAKYKGKFVGTFGDVSTWSFCQDKIISTGGEGGMISTNNKKIWKNCWQLKDHGKNYDKVFNKKHRIGYRWLHDSLGSNYRMTEIQAVIGRYQLSRLEKTLKKRINIAFKYIKYLKLFFGNDALFQNLNFSCLNCPLQDYKKCNKCRHSFYRLNLFINSSKIDNISIIKKLTNAGIDCNVGPCPELYLEKVFFNSQYRFKKDLKNAKLIGKKSISFPINPQKSTRVVINEINKITQILKKFFDV